MKITFYFLLLPVFYFVIGCSKETASPTPPPPTPAVVDTTSNLRVMTYNIHHANPPAMPNVIDVPAIAAIIKAQSPHLVALQEVDVNNTRSGITLHQAEELARLTGLKPYFGKAIDYAGGQYGVAILSKFPISGTANHALPTAAGTNGEARTLATAVITLGNGKKVVFASTHLDAQSSDTNRLLQATRIVEILRSEQLPVILAGDFNAVAGTRVINTLDAYFMRSCTNCPSTIPATNPTRAIDFIFFAPSNSFTVIDHKVLDEKTASDHRPVLAEIRIK
jgi:endonuclease/exonuclease/phosphatase family metal-dependent hydrolase